MCGCTALGSSVLILLRSWQNLPQARRSKHNSIWMAVWRFGCGIRPRTGFTLSASVCHLRGPNRALQVRQAG